MKINSGLVLARILIYSTFAVILTIGMREIAPILTTVFFSVFAALILIPCLWFKRKGVPEGLRRRSGAFRSGKE